MESVENLENAKLVEGEIIFADFYKTQRTVLKYIGIDIIHQEIKTRRDRVKKILRNIYVSLNISSNVLLLFWYLYRMKTEFKNRDANKFLEAFSQFVQTPHMLVRLFYFLINLRNIHTMIQELHKLFPTEKSRQQEFKIGSKYLASLLGVTKVFIGFGASVIITSIAYIIKVAISNGTNMIFDIEMPFDRGNVIAIFMINFWLIWIAAVSLAVAYSNILVLISSIISLCMQFDILGSEMKKSFSEPKVKFADIKELIIRHNKLIELSNQLESIYAPVLLYSFVHTTLIICVSGIVIFVTNGLNRSVVINSLSVILLTSYLCHHFGQNLYDSSVNVSEQIYSADWHLIEDLKVMKSVAFVIQIAQRPKYLTGNKFFIINKENFTNVRRLFDFI